jgi:hypothetical protein
MSNNLLDFPARQAQPVQTTPVRVTRAQREWLRRVLDIKVPRRRRAAAVGSSSARPTLKDAA